MITQKEFVEGCQRYYAENYYEPGNPEDGEWQDCHYPVPNCLHGDKVIKLLKHHHAVQGVLQSEEFNYPCIWGWEEEYLSGELLERFKFWKSELAKIANRASKTPEWLESLRKTFEEKSKEELGEAIRKGWETRRANSRERNQPLWSEEVVKSRNAKARETRLANSSPEQRSEKAKQGRAKQIQNTTPEERSAIARKSWETRRRNQQGG